MRSRSSAENLVSALLADVSLTSALFESFAETSIEGVVIYKDRKVIYVNKRMTQISGLAKESLVGQPVLNFFPKSEKKRIEKIILDRERGRDHNGPYETTFVFKNGTSKRVEVSGTTLKPGKGALVLIFIHDLSPRIRAYEELLKLSSAVSQIADSIVITNKEGIIQYVNAAFEKITGYKRDEVIGKSPSILASGVHNHAFYNKMWHTILKGQAFNATFVNQKKDKSRYYFEQVITPITNWQGEITHFASTGRDITSQRLFQEVLENSERQKQAVLDTIPDVIFIVNSKGLVLEIHGSVDLLDVPHTQLIGKKLSSFLPARLVKEALRNISEALRTEEAQKFEFSQMQKRGLRRYDATIIKISEKECLCIARDITDKQRYFEESKRYDFIVNTTKDHMSLINRKYRFEAVNDAYCAAHKKTREQIVGKHLKDIWGSARFNKYIKVWIDECFSGKEVRNHAWFEFGTRGRRYLEVTYYPYLGLPGIVTHAIVITHDLTERKVTEEQLDRLYKTQATLFAEIAHSLKTPFTVVLGNIDILAKDIPDELRMDILVNMRTSISAANAKVTELLKVAKLQMLPSQLELAGANLEEVLKEAYSRAKLLFRSYFPNVSQVELSQNLLLEIVDECKLVTSSTSLIEIILLLVENAIRHSPRDSEMPRVMIRQKTTDKNATIEIIDKGKGMTTDEVARAFELHYASSKTSGYGIGLPYCQKTVKALGGSIAITSRINKGTTVRITLPIK